ncbi:hypothetical protein ACFQU7_29595 [Pseudoroseomonas wenyumeiae]
MGDLHRRWDYLEDGLAALATPPAAAVLLGDMECDAPLDLLAAPCSALVWRCTGSSATMTMTAGRRCGPTSPRRSATR